jgi:hypothetical protein
MAKKTVATLLVLALVFLFAVSSCKKKEPTPIVPPKTVSTVKTEINKGTTTTTEVTKTVQKDVNAVKK